MRLVSTSDKDAVGNYVGDYICKRINAFGPTQRTPFVLGLPTGSTPMSTYRRLIEHVKAGRLSFRHVVTFNMDEYCGIPRSHPESYHTFMRQNLFDHVDIPAGSWHLLDGNAPDPAAECARYEAAIDAAGGVELFLGGIGPDGHVAFNEPGSSLMSRTRQEFLNDETVEANSRFFGGDRSKVPKSALTIGVGTFMDSREVILIVTGQGKAVALAAIVEGSVSHVWTASCVQMHNHATVVCDEAATGELKVKTVKYFKEVFAAEQRARL